jgi:crotonobetainyl-CoA:carnitine CoA-transferase CaiB-like acyl-CoA transferase
MDTQIRKVVSAALSAPRFSRTAPEIRWSAHSAGQDTMSVLTDYGFAKDEIISLQEQGIVAIINPR